MKANELRIGNLFIDQNTKTIISVMGLTEDNITFTGHFKNDWQAKPIPLTEEWLLSFGFKSNINKDSGCGHSIFNDFNLWIDNGKIIYWKVKGSVELKHVHKLQNLYFESTGEELKSVGKKIN